MSRPKQTKFKVWQEADGWHCSSSRLADVTTIAADPATAIKSHEKTLREFDRFCDHLHGRCRPSRCKLCKEGRIERDVYRSK